MRLRCEVRVNNRLLPSMNMRKPGKGTFTHVSLGRKPGNKDGPVFLMLCTAQNRNGDKYALKKNVEQIFSSFVKDGKATIRIRDPQDDILFSKADPSQLAKFLKLTCLASEGKEFPDKVLSMLAPVSSKQVEKPVTSLVVSRPSEYPMAFPKTLQSLMINHCCFRRVSPQVMTLSKLTFLDMSFNELGGLPDAFSQLVCLQSLNLTSNKLTTFPRVLLSDTLRNSLCHLHLGQNEIKQLPSDVIKLKFLQSLNLGHNQLQRLPESLGLWKSLRNLTVTANRLEFLPGSLLSHVFGVLDLSENPFMSRLPACDLRTKTFPVPTLAEWAARAIVANKMEPTEEDLDVMSRSYLSSVHFCLCGSPCFESGVKRFVRRSIPSILSYSGGDLPLLMYYCSKSCVRKFV